jgi:HAE1 family hydrophobic/amphiphilic exporter-1
LEIPVQLPKGGYIKLSDIASIERKYNNKNVSYGGVKDSADNHAVALVIYKANRVNIFSTASSAKSLIEETLTKPIFAGIQSAYTQDLSDIIVDDYKNLGSNGLQAVILIFLVTRFFIGFRQSLIATFAMPIAFFCTFIYLNNNGSTLNFMTNFSLVLTFGMGIDTVIVIIEAAYEYMKK